MAGCLRKLNSQESLKIGGSLARTVISKMWPGLFEHQEGKAAVRCCYREHFRVPSITPRAPGDQVVAQKDFEKVGR